MVICLSWGIFGETQAQQALEDRVADLEKKLLESQKNTQLLTEELDAVKFNLTPQIYQVSCS